MWAKKSKSQRADMVFRAYYLLILAIEVFVYDSSHLKAVIEPIFDFILG